MDKIAPFFPKAFTVSFSELSRWDPNSFHKIKWHWPESVMKPIGSVVFPRKEKVNRGNEHFVELMPITIHFDGSVEPRKMKENQEYSMELFWVKPGDIVVSKIDLKNGAVAIIPKEWYKAVVTNHFAVYTPDLEQLNPKYFSLLIQAGFFKAHLWRNKVGAEGRKEVKINFFEALKVPIPQLPIQQKIVDHWDVAKKQRIDLEHALLKLQTELNDYLVSQTKSFKEITNSKVLCANYTNIQQWDVKAGRAAAFISSNPDFLKLGDYTEECTATVKPWECPDKEWPIYGVNNKEGVFLSNNQLGKEFNAPYKVIQKDYFFHNPTRANVGSLGIVPDVPEDALTSPEYQVWRLKNAFLPDFMALMLRTEYFLALVAFNRVGGVKQRMYYSNLAEIRLPKVPRAIQQEFADKRKEILTALTKTDHLLEQRKIEIEQMILGNLPIQDN